MPRFEHLTHVLLRYARCSTNPRSVMRRRGRPRELQRPHNISAAVPVHGEPHDRAALRYAIERPLAVVMNTRRGESLVQDHRRHDPPSAVPDGQPPIFDRCLSLAKHQRRRVQVQAGAEGQGHDCEHERRFRPVSARDKRRDRDKQDQRHGVAQWQAHQGLPIRQSSQDAGRLVLLQLCPDYGPEFSPTSLEPVTKVVAVLTEPPVLHGSAAEAKGLHPVPATTSWHWLGDLRMAIEDRDIVAFDRRAEHIAAKLVQEAAWVAEDRAALVARAGTRFQSTPQGESEPC
jgi:hypothetical protein